MNSFEPVSARVRLAIVSWPVDAPRGAVTSFCEAEGISRNTFYRIRRRALREGPTAALEPLSRRAKTSPNKYGEEVGVMALQVRASLEASGLDHGPISVHEKMKQLGMVAPSVSWLARYFRAQGVSRKEPKKKPRAAWRSFVYPRPNDCWQIDATEYPLSRGRICVIFQVIDDHSRLAIASLVAKSETADAALEVLKQGIARHGVPQKVLSDNGTALNMERRGYENEVTVYLRKIGVKPITGKPGKPTTQGKNERLHQTLFKFLNKQPLANSIQELQTQVDRFDDLYNNERPHQGLPGRITPRQAWNATPKAEEPHPQPPQTLLSGPNTQRRSPERPPTGYVIHPVSEDGRVYLHKVDWYISTRWSQHEIIITWEDNHYWFLTHDAVIITEYDHPGDGNRKGIKTQKTPTTPPDTIDQIRYRDQRRHREHQQTSPMS